MQVFKYYFRLARTLRTEALTYIVLFITMMILMSLQMPSGATFTVQKPRVTIVNHDNGTFTHGLVDYIGDNSQIVSLADTTEARKDALYFQTVDAIYVIPSQFSEDYFAGKNPTIEMTHGTGQAPIQADNLVSNYLRLATPRTLAHMDQQAVVDGVKSDLKQTITVETNSQSNMTDVSKAMYYMNIESYIILGLNVMVISFIMLRFNGKMVRRRNLVSGTPYRRIALSLFAGNALFSVFTWALFLGVACILYPNVMLGQYGMMYAISSFMYSLVTLAIGFMIGSLVSNIRVIPPVTNVIALGMSFLCGVFVPQQFLGESVVNASKALPAYWYVNANDSIAKLTDFGWHSLQPIIVNWIVIFGFAAALLALTFVLVKRRAR